MSRTLTLDDYRLLLKETSLAIEDIACNLQLLAKPRNEDAFTSENLEGRIRNLKDCVEALEFVSTELDFREVIKGLDIEDTD